MKKGIRWTTIFVENSEFRLLTDLLKPMISKTKMKTHSAWITLEPTPYGSPRTYLILVPALSEEHQLILNDLGFKTLDAGSVSRSRRKECYHQIRKL